MSRFRYAPPRPGAGFVLPGLLAAAFVFHLLTLLRTPEPFVDEAWNAARALAFLQTGRAFGPLDSGVLDRFDGYWTYPPLLPTWFQSLGIETLGVTLFSVRLVSLLFGLALLVAVYAIARNLYDRLIATAAASITAVSGAFLYSSHLARPDIMAAAVGFGAIALYLRADPTSVSVLSGLAGLAAGLAIEIHPYGAVYGAAIGTLYVLDNSRNAFRKKGFWTFTAGAVVGTGFYLAVHVIPYPQTYFELSRLFFGPTRIPPMLVPDAAVWGHSIFNTLIILASFEGWWIPLLVPALGLLAVRRSAADRRLLALFGALFVTMVLGIRTEHPYYGILISPVADIALAVLLVTSLRKKLVGTPWDLSRTVLVAGIAVTAVAANLAPTLNDPMPEYDATLSKIAQVVPPGRSVMASQVYWFGIHDRKYLSWEQLIFYQRANPGSSLHDAFAALHPDYFIIDEHMTPFIADDPGHALNYDGLGLYLPRVELEAFLGRQGHLVAELGKLPSGSIRVYEIEWRTTSERDSLGASGK